MRPGQEIIMRQQIFILISISLAALAMACGGVEPGDVGSSTIQPLQTAPMDVLGLDLPGCEDLSGIMGELSENRAHAISKR